MRKVFSTLLVACLLCLAAAGGELLVAALGKCNHQIVVPDEIKDPLIKESIDEAATLIQRAFAENDAQVPVVKESEADSKKPGIYLGPTRFAAEHGVDVNKLKDWECVVKVVGKNIVIAGHDETGPIRGRRKRPLSWLGTLKGTTTFLRKHAGVRFLTPGAHGIEFLPTPVIYLPDDLDVVERPGVIENDFWSKSEDIYFLANFLQPFQKVKDYYGHQHPRAVPVEKLRESHPEYFILTQGVRGCDARNYAGKRIGHLCLANPEVQTLIYKKLLADCDEGYDIPELGQGDGFMGCGCDYCAALYDVDFNEFAKYPRTSHYNPGWGEKIWIMHRDMAERLKKDRPDKKVMILAYSVGAMPPRTFDAFPDNVIIELCRHSPEYIDAWKKIDVPGGFGVYVYNWCGSRGWEPQMSPRQIEEQIRRFRDVGVNIVRTHGFGNMSALLGPTHYVYLRMIEAPDEKLSADALLEEYFQAAFRETVEPMRKFFKALYKRLDAVQGMDKSKIDPIHAQTVVYTPDLLNTMEADLAKAEKMATSERVKKRLEQLRCEFDYIKHSATVAHMYYAYLASKDKDALRNVLDAVEARDQWLADLPAKRNGKNVSSEAPSFHWRQKEQIKYERGLNRPPYNWDVAKKRAELAKSPRDGNTANEQPIISVRSTDKTVTITSPVWKTVAAEKMTGSDGGEAAPACKLLRDQDNLFIRVDAPLPTTIAKLAARGRDGPLWKQPAIDVALAPLDDRAKRYHFAYEPVPKSFYDAAFGFITEEVHPAFGKDDVSWNGKWSYENKLDEKRKRWISMVAIPFKTLGVESPKPGASWLANVALVQSDGDKTTFASWPGEGLTENGFDPESFGEIAFE